MEKYLLASMAFLLALMGGVYASANAAETEGKIRIVRRGTQPSVKGPDANFTGSVRVDHPITTEAPARIYGGYVTFEPGARTAWHSHSLGQTIIVTSGKCLVQEWDGPIEEAFAGDVVWFPPNVKHWHGASPDTAMTHLALVEIDGDSSVAWMEKVSDEQYGEDFSQTDRKSNSIKITRAGSAASGAGNPSFFTGRVRTDVLFPPLDGTRAYGNYVTFEPGARTNWHTHKMGQALIVTMGRGFVQEEAGPLIEIREGDIVWFPAGVNHWHGAAPETAMVHISLSERVDGNTAWGGRVTGAPYDSATTSELPLKQQKIALISAFTASGDIDRLKSVLIEGLDAGLTVNEIKEVLTQMYAYTGFPRALNAVIAFIAVLDEREAKGIKDELGPEATEVVLDKSKYDYGYGVLQTLRNTTDSMPLSRAEQFAPTMEVFLKEHLFADIFMRDNLDYLSREIATVGALSNLPGANPQLRSHINISMNMGATEEQMRHLLSVMGGYLGKERADNALSVLETVIKSRRKQ